MCDGLALVDRSTHTAGVLLEVGRYRAGIKSVGIDPVVRPPPRGGAQELSQCVILSSRFVVAGVASSTKCTARRGQIVDSEHMFDDLLDVALEAELCSQATHVSAGECLLVLLIGEFDRRRG